VPVERDRIDRNFLIIARTDSCRFFGDRAARYRPESTQYGMILAEFHVWQVALAGAFLGHFLAARHHRAIAALGRTDLTATGCSHTRIIPARFARPLWRARRPTGGRGNVSAVRLGERAVRAARQRCPIRDP